MNLTEYLKGFPKAALAFSGGVDSSYLLYAAKQAGCAVTPYYVKTAFQPKFEFEDAKRMAEFLEIPMRVLTLDVLACAPVVANPPDRCYYCKQVIFGEILRAAHADGHTVLFDGNNASDDAGDRPGMRAAKELHVRSPLRECGLGKPEIRRLSREAGLFTAEKPAYACLATRIPAGTPIDGETLQKVERAEAFLTDKGFSDFRVRVLGNAAKLQLTENEFAKLFADRRQILDTLRASFADVLLDLTPRGEHHG